MPRIDCGQKSDISIIFNLNSQFSFKGNVNTQKRGLSKDIRKENCGERCVVQRESGRDSGTAGA